ncbi:squalene synthetase-like protein [Datura stramonium]|uniref:Squalene synthetase-like protein n=1 Tax=Datura stramonium TaxID=4076 RepID=A0ABS8SZ12_DATST|nr:squalene synthetase-like protein [Datura stramonium]
MYNLRDPAIFRFCAIPQVMAIGTLAMCYDNIEVFRGVVKMRRGLTAKVIDRTRTMADVYGAFFDFSCMLKSKVNNNDPNATKTLKRLEAVLKTCRDSGTLNKRKSYIIRSEPNYSPVLIVIIFIIQQLFLHIYLKPILDHLRICRRPLYSDFHIFRGSPRTGSKLQ